MLPERGDLAFTGCKRRFVLFLFRGQETARFENGGQSAVTFSHLAQKNTTRSLTVWIVGTDIERELFSVGRCAILDTAN